jgi:acyl-CoA-binding protein
MSLQDDFEAAKERSQRFPEKPSVDAMLELYALYKQGAFGDVSGDRPSVLDIRGRAKYDAWARKRGMSRDQAMRAYIGYVDELAAARPAK